MQAPNKNRALRRLDKYINEISKLDDGTNTNSILSLLQEFVRIQSEIEKMSNFEAECYCSVELAKLEANKMYSKIMKKYI